MATAVVRVGHFGQVGHVEPASLTRVIRILILIARKIIVIIDIFCSLIFGGFVSLILVAVLLDLLVGVAEEAMADERHSASKDDCRDEDQREASRDDKVATREGGFDPKDETESDGASDQPRVPDESQFFVVKRIVVLALILAELEQADETDGRHESAENDDCHEDKDQADGERHGAIREEGQAEVAEYEAFSDEAQELEDDGQPYENIEEIWPDYPTKEDFFFNEDEY